MSNSATTTRRRRRPEPELLDRQPPASVEAERNVIGSLLLMPEMADEVVPVLRAGKLVYQPPTIHEARQRTQDQLARFHGGVKRFVHPHQYPVGLEMSLAELKTRLILQARGEET